VTLILVIVIFIKVVVVEDVSCLVGRHAAHTAFTQTTIVGICHLTMPTLYITAHTTMTGTAGGDDAALRSAAFTVRTKTAARDELFFLLVTSVQGAMTVVFITALVVLALSWGTTPAVFSHTAVIDFPLLGKTSIPTLASPLLTLLVPDALWYFGGTAITVRSSTGTFDQFLFVGTLVLARPAGISAPLILARRSLGYTTHTAVAITAAHFSCLVGETLGLTAAAGVLTLVVLHANHFNIGHTTEAMFASTQPLHLMLVETASFLALSVSMMTLFVGGTRFLDGGAAETILARAMFINMFFMFITLGLAFAAMVEAVEVCATRHLVRNTTATSLDGTLGSHGLVFVFFTSTLTFTTLVTAAVVSLTHRFFLGHTTPAGVSSTSSHQLVLPLGAMLSPAPTAGSLTKSFPHAEAEQLSVPHYLSDISRRHVLSGFTLVFLFCG